jgi:hypothetical protein
MNDDDSKQHIWILIVTAVIISMAYLMIIDASKYATEFRIMQTGLSDYHPNLLLERCPLVIQDGVTDATLLLDTCFRHTYIWADIIPIVNSENPYNPWKCSMSKYVIVHNPYADYDLRVAVAHPDEKTKGTWRAAPGHAAFLIEEDVDLTATLTLTLTLTADLSAKSYVEVVLHPYQSIIIPCHWIWKAQHGAVEVSLMDIVYKSVAAVKRVII